MAQNKKHQLRLSLDLRSIKQQDFTAQLYLKYNPIPQLNIKNFRSAPTVPINNPKLQVNLTNCFCSYYFEATGQQINQKLNRSIKVQLWHSDRLKKDILLGVSNIQLKNFMQVPLKKTKQSYARVLDAYVPVDQIDQNDKPIKKIASLRVLVYLEDMGPVDLLKNKGFEIRDLLQDENNYNQVQDPKLPSQNKQLNFEGDSNQRMQLNELQYKVVWELQTWKKAQQAKTRITLKQKQIEFWTNLSEQQKKTDVQKEKHFKKIQANLNILQTKLKGKMNELIKRQQKIIVFEQQLQSKITQTGRQLFNKDQQIQRIKKKAKQEKTVLLKEKSTLQLEVSKFRAQNAKLRVQIEQARKQDEKSPVNILKNQLNMKMIEIKQLSKELQKCNEIKEEYKIYYQKMKNQVINIREKLNQKEQALRQLKYEKDILLNNYKNLQSKFSNEKNRRQHQYQNYAPYDMSYEEDERADYYGGGKQLNQKGRLIKARNDLLSQGLYSEHDDLIKEYDRQIASLG